MSGTVLSSAECQIILKRYLGDENFQLLGYSNRPLSENVEGFMGDHMWLTIRYEKEEAEFEKTFFLKAEPAQFEMQLEFSAHCNAFNNEICFYEKLVPEFKKYYPRFDNSIFPTFYHSKGSNYLVLENCSENHFKMTDSIDIFDMNHIKLVLQAFAKLHAASIILEERKSEELGREYQLTDDYQEYLKETFFQKDENHLGYKFVETSKKCILSIIDLMPEYDDISKEKFIQSFLEFSENCFELSQPSKKFRNVLCHADLWGKNIMYKYENDVPVSCKMYDFQLMKYSPPIYDLMKFVFQVTSSEIRQHHLDDIMNYYYDRLHTELKLGNINAEKVLPYDELIVSAKQLLPYILMEAAYYYAFLKIPQDYFKTIMKDKEAYKNFVFNDRSEVVTKYYKPGSDYKIWMDEIILEIKDVISHDGFSQQDCRTMLKNKLNSTNYELLKYEITMLGEQNGFMGAHKKIKVHINREGKQEQLNFFGKFLPTTEFSLYTVESKAFDNEKFMYDHIFTKIAKFNINIYDCVPKNYFARKNDVLVFEDLNESGFQQISKHKSLKYESLIVIIETLAKYHAAFLIFEEKMSEATGRQYRIPDEYVEELQDVCYIKKEGHIGRGPVLSLIKGVQTHIDLFPDPSSRITDEDFKKKAMKVYDDLMYKFSEPSKKYRNVICHGDLWASNILMKYENGKPVQAKFVDFQCIKKCPPAQDLMALIYLTTSRKFRSNYMNEIVDLYYEKLGKYLLEYDYDVELIVPYNELIESCEYYKTFAIAQTVSHFHFIMSTAEDMAELFKDNELCYNAFYVDRSEYIVKMCKQNPHYKTVLNESLKDFRILCETLNL